MKRHFLVYTTLASVLGLAACTQDESGMLPDGTQPLALTASIEGGADTRATVDNTWSDDETMALQVNGGDWYNYTAGASGYFTGNYYWQSKDPITVQGICPAIAVESTTWSVKNDQSSDADYQSGDLLCSESKAVSFAQTPALTFYHQTAKVVVNVSQEGLPESISVTPGDISLTIGEGDILALDGAFTLPTAVDADGRWLGTWTPGPTKGSVTPHLATATETGNFATYEALVIPQTIRSGAWLLTFNATKDDTGYGPFYYMLQNDTEWKAGYKYTYNVTITLYGLQVSVDTDGMTWGDGADGEGAVELPV